MSRGRHDASASVRRLEPTGVDGGDVTWRGWSKEGFGVLAPADAAYYAAEMAAAGFGRIERLKVLEIGYGNGCFARWAIDNGADYFGLEIDEALLAWARAAGWRVAPSLEELETLVGPTRFDLVVAIDVLEHLSEDGLRRCLRSSMARLASNGRLLARVPSGDSPFARAIQYGDPTHRLVLGSQRIRRLATELGFELLALREPAYPLKGLGARVWIRRALARAVRRLAHAAVARLLMEDAGVIVSPNLVFVLANPCHSAGVASEESAVPMGSAAIAAQPSRSAGS